MRISKRILALALALLLVVGLFPTASANLNDMPDVDQVSSEFRLAMGVLTGMDILRGQDVNGTISAAPQATITRAEMVTIIYRMMHGHSNAPTGAQVFHDVPASHWAAGFISWAATQGIVAGRGNGNFDPAATVTIVEAAAMMLRTLGYGVNGEYEGAGWDSRTSADATRLGVFNVLLGTSFNLTDGASRERAAQMAYNTLGIAEVSYSPVFGYIPTTGFGQPPTTIGGRIFNYVNAPRWENAIVNELTQENGLVTFVDFTGTTVGTARHAVRTDEVGRVVNVHAAAGANPRVFFLDVVSTDVLVTPAMNTWTLVQDALRTAGVNDVPSAVRSYPNFEFGISTLNLATDFGTAGVTWRSNGVLVTHQNTVRSAVWSTRSVERVEITTANITANPSVVQIAGVAHPVANITNNSSVALNEVTATGANAPFVNVEQVGTAPDRFVLSDVQAVTGLITEVTNNGGTIVLDGRTFTLNTTDGVDNNNAATQINASLAGYTPLTQDTIIGAINSNFWTTEWTVLVSGVTGNAIALFSPDAEGVMTETFAYVVNSNTITGWTNTYQAEVIWADGTREIIEADEDMYNFKERVVELSRNAAGLYSVEGNDVVVDIGANTNTNIPLVEIDGLHVDALTRFVYIELAADDVTVESIVTAQGRHSGIIQDGTEVGSVQRGATDLADVVFVLAARQDAGVATDVVFVQAQAPITTPAGVTVRAFDVTTGAQQTLTLTTAPDLSTAGFFRINVAGENVTLTPVAAPVAGITFVGTPTEIDEVDTNPAGYITFTTNSSADEWLVSVENTVIVDLRPNGDGVLVDNVYIIFAHRAVEGTLDGEVTIAFIVPTP